MTREWVDKPDPKWETLHGERPYFVLDRHPSEDYIAMQVSAWINTGVERAAVWNTKTHKIEWNPGNANALCWAEDGTRVLVLTEVYTPDPNRPKVFATPLQREYKYFLEIRSWADKELISSIEVAFPTGWVVDVIASPTTPIACFVWMDQHEAGIELVSWKDGHLCQMPRYGYFGNSNLVQGPAFSPDGSLVAFSYGEGFWWSDAPDVSSQGGTFKVGWVVIGEVASGTYQEMEIFTSVPEGWLPDDPEDIRYELLSCPVFIDCDTIKLNLPTGEEHLLSVRAQGGNSGG